MKSSFSALCLGFLAALNACGGDEENKGEPSCNYMEQTGCRDGLVCEQLASEPERTGCFAPVLVEGRVVTIDDPEQGVEGARVVARDENGAVVSYGIAISRADGSYSLRVPATREEGGAPAIPGLSLRADAPGFATFPSGLRVAIPVDVSAPESSARSWVVANGSTDIALDELPDAADFGSISGKVLAESAVGTLVVAGSTSAVADKDGSYVMFNVPAGDHEVRGYGQGLSLEPAQASVEAGVETEGIDLAASDAALGAVEGSVSFVNAGSQETSVVLVVDSTFNESLKRGEVPRGLRAYPVSGPYSFVDVPAGDYVVLAAFENDELVRDPDESIGGTAVQRISVGSEVVDVTSFKITGALAVVGPGAEAAEPVEAASLAFEWADDSSEDGYELTVLDTFGTEIWKDVDVPRVTGSDTVTHAYAGPDLEPGYYQFRAVSWRQEKGATTGRVYISATEDLRGVFVIE